MRFSFSRGLVVVAAIAVTAFAIAAFAAGNDDRAVAESTLADLEKDAHTKELCADPIARSRTALERARRMRAAGDDKHARLAEGLAVEWARVGQELARADAVETRAATARTAATDAGAHVERERATLEQQLAENGRLQAELAKLESRDGGAAPPPPPRRDVDVPRDGGAK